MVESLMRTVESQHKRIEILESKLRSEDSLMIRNESTSKKPRKVVVLAKAFSEVYWMEHTAKVAGFPVDYAIVRSYQDHGLDYEDAVLYVFVVAYTTALDNLPLPSNYLIFNTDVQTAIPSPNVVPMHILSEKPFTITKESKDALIAAIKLRMSTVR